MNQLFDLLTFSRLRDFGISLCRAGIIFGLFIGLVLSGCQAPAKITAQPMAADKPISVANLSEVSPPVALEELNEWFDQYQPQIRVISPGPGELVSDTQVAVQIGVENLPIFEDAKTGLGPYLQVSVDNQAPQITSTPEQPLTFKDLTPGTHIIRALVIKPWGESFKTAGAYAQAEFHVLTRSEENHPRPNLPLLTANQTPTSFGAEPFLLDFYLSNAPLHSVAQARDDLPDWQVKATINGTSFTVDRWQSFYLTGLRPGKNWIRLELLDERGRAIETIFNPVAWAVDYQPNDQDARSRLFRGELTAKSVQGSLSPQLESNLPPVVMPEPEPSPEAEVIPTPEPELLIPKETSERELKAESEILEPQESPGPTASPQPDIPAAKPQRSWRNLFTKEAKPTTSPATESEILPPPEPTVTETPEAEVELEITEIEELPKLPAPQPQRSWRNFFNQESKPENPEITAPRPVASENEVAAEVNQGTESEATTSTVLEAVEIEAVETGIAPEPIPAPKKSWRDFFSKSAQPPPATTPGEPESIPTEAAANPGPESPARSEAADAATPETSQSDPPAWSEILAPVAIPKPQTPPPVIQAQPNPIQLPSRYRRSETATQESGERGTSEADAI